MVTALAAVMERKRDERVEICILIVLDGCELRRYMVFI